MKNFVLLSILLILVGCQASGGGGGADGGGIISGHVPVAKEFTLSTPLNTNYSTGQTITFTLNFPAAVTVTGNPKLTVNIGGVNKDANFSSVSGQNLYFTYTVVGGDVDNDGISVSSTLNLNGATLKFNTTEDTGTVINVPSLASVKVNPPGGSPPVASNITPPNFNEDTSSTITLSYTDADGDLATSCTVSGLIKVSVSTPCACAAGVCTVGVTGVLNQNGAAGFNYTVTANAQVSNSASASFTLNPVPDVPVANNITPAAFPEDTQSIITLSYTDGDGDLATTCAISAPTNVTVTQACACAAGVCTVGVTGTLNYFGAASFNYTVTANAQVSNSATASLTITSVNDAPVANNITPAAFNEDTQSIITLSYTDADGDLATTCAISSPTNVTVTQACACAAGTCTVGVTGTANYSGAASFGYTVTANGQTSNTATATLTIDPVDDAPIANNITPASFPKNTQSIITLSYSDVESDLATSCSISGLTNVTETQACACAAGTCTVGVTGTLDYFGSASFNYTVTANALVSNLATATLTIDNVDSPPVADNITPAAFDEDVQSIITLSYSDADSDLATSCSISSPTNVTVTQACACAAGTCTVGVTGTTNYNGAASFNYTVTANSAVSNSASATLTINPVDDAPVADNITPASFPKNTQSIITLSYTDVESDLATSCSVSGLTNVTETQACACAAGTCTVGVTGTAGYTGAASFNYTVTANALVSNSATATLTITSSAPVANNISPAAFDEDVQSIITLSYTDADSDLATSCTTSSPTNVTVTQACACAAGTCTVGVTGTTNYNGTASFNYTVTTVDGTSNSASATMTINPVDDAPVADNITPASFPKNTQSIITLSYSDVESHLATSCSVSGLTNVTETQACACAAGTCTVGVTGTFNYFGAASFNYTVTANALVSNSATASLTIDDVDSPPVANNISPAAFNEDTQSIITLSYTDANSDLATSCAISSPTNVTVTQACACAAGTCTVGVTGTLNYNGAASFNYTVTANSAVSNSATASLTIDPVDDAPVANNITPAAFDEDTQSIITLSYTDVEGDFATSCSISNLSNVTVTQSCACAAGTCTVGVTGTANYSGVASFDYTVTTNVLISNTATASLTISGVLDAPTTANFSPSNFNEDTQSVITLPYTNNGDPATSCSTSALTNVTVTQACACAAGVCTVGVTGTANYNGAASFQFQVSAGPGADSNNSTASFTILPVDDPASLGAIGAQSTTPNTAKAVAFTFSDPDGAVCSSARLSMTSSNTSVVANGAVSWSGTAPNCTATITPQSNALGTSTITITATDGGLPNKTTNFVLTVSGALLRWEYPINTVITSYSFGTPGANTNVVLKLRNYGDATSGTVSITDDNGSPKISQSNGCTTLAANATCDVTVSWDQTGGPGFRQEIYTATVTGSSANVTVSGTK